MYSFELLNQTLGVTLERRECHSHVAACDSVWFSNMIKFSKLLPLRRKISKLRLNGRFTKCLRNNCAQVCSPNNELGNSVKYFSSVECNGFFFFFLWGTEGWEKSPFIRSHYGHGVIHVIPLSANVHTAFMNGEHCAYTQSTYFRCFYSLYH